jgi:predicted DNA-binding antitoxin AbrB/MazE fold protein
MTIAAIYEKGMLRLMEPMELPEGSSVEIIVIPKPSYSQPKSPADILAEIAALPLEDNADTFSGRDHDKILYPDQNSL